MTGALVGTTDVVVVGAGPAGLAAACGLLGSGVPVRVLDGAAGPAVTSRALGLQPRMIEVLDRLDALGDLPARSLPIRQVVVRVDGRELGRLPVGKQTPLVRRPGLMVAQTEVEGALRARLAQLGGDVEWGRQVVAVDQDRHEVTITLAGGETLRTGWVVGCDGAHSQVRAAAGIGFPGVPLAERFLLADVHVDLGLPRDEVVVWLRGAEMLSAFPLPGADLWRLMAPAPGGTEVCAEAVLGELTDLLRRHAGVTAGVRGCEWTSVFRIHRRLAQSYRRGRVLLAGDAAHVHSPFGGQGMNTGLSDVENLSWKLALVCRGRAGMVLLDSYAAERRPVAEKVLASTSSLTGLVLGERVSARLLRDHVVVPLLNQPLAQRLILEQASQLRLSYRGGPLAPRSWSARRLGSRPGDRVPDVACAREDGVATRLHAELGPCWALLAPRLAQAQACAAVARGGLGADLVVRLIPAVALTEALLVRPDGHLAWSGRNPAGLAQWLSGALGRDPGAGHQTPTVGTGLLGKIGGVRGAG